MTRPGFGVPSVDDVLKTIRAAASNRAGLGLRETDSVLFRVEVTVRALDGLNEAPFGLCAEVKASCEALADAFVEQTDDSAMSIISEGLAKRLAEAYVLVARDSIAGLVKKLREAGIKPKNTHGKENEG